MRFSVGLCALILAGCGAATDAELGGQLPTTDETERLRAELEEAREEMERLRAEAEAAKAQETPAAEPPVSSPPPTSEAPPEPEVAPEPEPEAPEIEAQPDTEPEPEEEAEQPEPPPEIEVEIAPPLSAPPPEPEPPPEPPAVCGDGVVQSAEVCEPELNPDGSFRAPWPGGCNHLCTAVYQEKRIRRTLHHSQAFGGVAGADALCQEDWGPGWKALLVGEGRRATVTPLMGDGQIDWVIQPWTFYVDDSSAYNTPESIRPLVWRTESRALLGVHDDSTEREYIRPEIDNSLVEGEVHWSGYHADWTSGENCQNWTIDDGRSSVQGTRSAWDPRAEEWYSFSLACIGRPTYLRCVEQ